MPADPRTWLLQRSINADSRLLMEVSMLIFGMRPRMDSRARTSTKASGHQRSLISLGTNTILNSNVPRRATSKAVDQMIVLWSSCSGASATCRGRRESTSRGRSKSISIPAPFMVASCSFRKLYKSLVLMKTMAQLQLAPFILNKRTQVTLSQRSQKCRDISTTQSWRQ